MSRLGVALFVGLIESPVIRKVMISPLMEESFLIIVRGPLLHVYTNPPRARELASD